jgi:hypothetical protein
LANTTAPMGPVALISSRIAAASPEALASSSRPAALSSESNVPRALVLVDVVDS